MSNLVPVLILPYVGTHICKDDLLNVLKSDDTTRSYQIFLRSNLGGNCKITPELIEMGKYVKTNQRKVFVHSPYTINLCKETEGDKYIKMLIDDLVIGLDLGLKGVVVHVGKACGNPKGYEMMVRNTVIVLKSYEYIAKQKLKDASMCPLLLETPAGQGTELLTTPKEFIDFITTVRKHLDNPMTLKICVDTCHVFASGYEPIDYIKQIDPDDLPLIHFNGSKDKKGSKKDRHEFFTSMISVESMLEVYKYAIQHSISMTKE